MVLPRRLDKIRTVVSQRQKDIVLVIEDVHDPHNAEAIFRTCDAFGIQDVYLIFDKTIPWNPTSIGKSSSSSAHKWLTFHTFRSSEECFASLREQQYSLIGTVLSSAAQNLFSFTFPSRIALIIGNEHRGLSPYALEQADSLITLPMRGMVESLNVSVATALFLYEITRQRTLSRKSFVLAPSDQQNLTEHFATRSRRKR